MKLNNIFKYTIILGLLAIGMVSCVSSGDNPGIEYAPNMYTSQAYEPFTQEQKFDYNPNGMTMRLPVNGTVARGQANFIYPHPNTGDGYAASASYIPWVEPNKTNVEEGERLYGIFCVNCHGKKGKNDGTIFKSKKIPAPSWPNYQSDYIKELPLGKAYHTIVYGKGLMGSHAFMLDPEERWKVIHYVKALAFGDDFEYSPENTSEDVINDDADTNETKDLEKQQDESISYGNFPDFSEGQAIIGSSNFETYQDRRVTKIDSESSIIKIKEYRKIHPSFETNKFMDGYTDITMLQKVDETLGIERINNVIRLIENDVMSAANFEIRNETDTNLYGNTAVSEDSKANRRVELEYYI